MLEHIDKIKLIPWIDPLARKVDDDIIPLANGLGGKHAAMLVCITVIIEIETPIKRDRMLHDIAIIGDHVKANAIVRNP